MADERKKTYYVSMATGEISQLKTASPWDFQIEATDEEIARLREYFDQNYSTDWQAFGAPTCRIFNTITTGKTMRTTGRWSTFTK